MTNLKEKYPSNFNVMTVYSMFLFAEYNVRHLVLRSMFQEVMIDRIKSRVCFALSHHERFSFEML